MSARPVNEEQLQAELLGLDQLGGWFIQLRAGDWFNVVVSLRLASTHPESSEPMRDLMRRTADKIEKCFPPECREIRHSLAAWKEGTQ